jgi:hypothetical protein
MECLSEKPPQSINAGHTSRSAASRLVHNENPNAKKTQAATRIPSNGHNQSQLEAEPLVEPVSIANSPGAYHVSALVFVRSSSYAKYGTGALTALHVLGAGRFPRPKPS